MDATKATPELFAALSKAQAKVENASKTSTNPHFRSKYADLAEVLNTIRPPFSAEGLSVLQSTEFDGERVSVCTLVAHSGGGYIVSRASCTPAKTDAQGIGAATTYLRRYGLAAMAGIAQEDDDGQSAAHERPPVQKITPLAGVAESLSADQLTKVQEVRAILAEYLEGGDMAGAADYITHRANLDTEEKLGLWTLLDSKTRSALKAAMKVAA